MMEALAGVTTKIFAADYHINETKPSLVFPKSAKFCIKSATVLNNSSGYSVTLSHPRSSSSATQVTHCLSPSNSESGSETTGISKLVSVKFQLKKECPFGDHFYMVGDDPILGSWNPLDAVPFNWSEGHNWTLVLEIPVEKSVRYKFLLKKSSGETLWQPGSDRVFKPWETENVITVSEAWENAEAQEINEEQKIIDGDEELIAKALVDPSVMGFHGKQLVEDPEPTVDDNVIGSGSDDRNTSELNANNDASSKSKSSPETAKRNSQKGARVDRNPAEAEDEGSLDIDDEGPVLVPGLASPFLSSEEV